MSAQDAVTREVQASLAVMLSYARDYITRSERAGVPPPMAPENRLALCRALIEATASRPESGTEQAPAHMNALPPAAAHDERKVST